jgi:preprotein translocase subunit SecG
MMLAAIDWLSISINLLLVIFVIVCLLMTLLVLMQRPKQEGLGAAFGGGVTDQVFGARTTNVLQRGTVYLGSLFFLLSLALAVLIGLKNKKVGTLDQAPAVVEETSKDAPQNEATTPPPTSLAEQVPDANSQTTDATAAAESTTTNDESTAEQSTETDQPTEESAAQEGASETPADEGAKETPAEDAGEDAADETSGGQ